MALLRIDGLDTSTGLGFFAGQTEVYLRALQSFAALYCDGLRVPDGAMTGTDGAGTADLQQAAHSLAGASLVLGATALGTHAQRLTELLAAPVADGRQAEQQLQRTQHALAALVQQLQTQLPAA